jgi:ATP-dependent DNA ligase
MIATDVLSAAATWRPQLFGDRRAATIPDPIVEPLWTGPRILVLVDGSTVRLSDADGQQIDGYPEIVDALREAAAGTTALLEAFLTPEPIQARTAIAGRESLTMPKSGEAMTQMIVGTRGDRKDRLAMQKDEARRRTVEGADERVAVVAVDLLWLDDESLFDVPLLERKRILESVLPESDLVRVGIHVKPPIDAWLGSWRSFGFRRLAYKAANSRYIPGHKNQDWATATIPPR